MSFTYTRSQLKSDINQGIHGKIGMIANQNDFVNQVVRKVHNDVAIRSARRKQSLSPDLFNGIYRYSCPADLNHLRIIDIPAQAKRQDDSFDLVPTEEFNRDPRPGSIAFDDYNGTRILLIDSQVDSESVTLDTTQDADAWTAVGDAENIERDGTDYITGSASLSFDINADGNTTAGIERDDLSTTDITDYLDGHSAVFTWFKINSTTDLTNVILRLGSSTGNYYSKTVTAQADGTAFVVGWNLLRFPLTSLSETGTVTNTSITYAALYMTKDAGKVSETDYKFNGLFLKRGVIHDILYYSNYGWTTSAGVYIQNSTDDSDLLVADQGEYEIFVAKGVVEGKKLTNFDRSDINDAKEDYQMMLNGYGPQNPDESRVMSSRYHEN